MNTTIKFQPVLFGALVMGVLSALPIVAGGNLCCCLWIVGGGVVAAYLQQQGKDAPITPADGALVGFLAGLLGAVVHMVVSVPINLVLGPIEREMMRRSMENMSGAEGFREYSERANLIAGPIRVAISFIFMLFLGAVFSTIGGLIGAMMFRKTAPAPLEAPPL